MIPEIIVAFGQALCLSFVGAGVASLGACGIILALRATKEDIA